MSQNGAILRGEDGAPEDAINENEVVASKLWDIKEGDDVRERRRQQLEEAENRRREEEENHRKINEQKLQVKINEDAEIRRRNLEIEQNKILQGQLEQALDRGKAFKDRLDKEGADEQDVNTVMNTLEKKMQRVEDLLEADKTR